MTFEEWWELTHDWPNTGSGLYETRFREAFTAGYNACRDDWGGLEYNDPYNEKNSK